MTFHWKRNGLRPGKRRSAPMDALRLKGCFVCIIQLAAAAVLPALTFLWVYNGHLRWSIESYVHWGVSTLAGLLGVVGLVSGSSGLLCSHVVLGGLAAAALTAHDAASFALLELRCTMQQAAFAGCSACACAAASSCTEADLAATVGCTTCSAVSTTFCSKFDSNKIIVAVTAIVTLLSMAAPVVFTLLALLQQKSGSSVAAARLLAARSSLAAQLQLLEEGRPLTLNASALADSIGVLRDSRDAESMRLADAALAAFQKAAASGAKAKEANKDAHAHTDHTIDIPASGVQQQEDQASLLGRSLYGPASEHRTMSTSVAAVAAGESISRTPSLAPPSRKSSVLSMRSSLASTPLLRSSTDFSSKIGPLQRPMQPTALMESSVMMGSPQSMHSFVLPGESDAVDQSLQLHSSLDVPTGLHSEAKDSSKHRHHKSRRHHKERPQKQEALAAMSGAYGMPIEKKPRKVTQRQDLDGDSDASDYL